jgi:hypothetical protein
MANMQAVRASSGITLHQTVHIDASGVNPTGFAENIKASVRQETMAAIDASGRNLTRRLPAEIARHGKLGTSSR